MKSEKQFFVKSNIFIIVFVVSFIIAMCIFVAGYIFFPQYNTYTKVLVSSNSSSSDDQNVQGNNFFENQNKFAEILNIDLNSEFTKDLDGLGGKNININSSKLKKLPIIKINVEASNPSDSEYAMNLIIEKMRNYQLSQYFSNYFSIETIDSFSTTMVVVRPVIFLSAAASLILLLLISVIPIHLFLYDNK